MISPIRLSTGAFNGIRTARPCLTTLYLCVARTFFLLSLFISFSANLLSTASTMQCWGSLVVIIYARPDKQEALWLAVKIYEYIRRLGEQAYFDISLYNYIGEGYSYDDLRFTSQKKAIVIGGDGTLLHAMRLIGCRQVDVLPIKVGRRGSYYKVTADRWIESVKALVEGRYSVEFLPRLNVEVFTQSSTMRASALALNDVALLALGSKTVELQVEVDGSIVYSSVEGDGVLVATPQGSHAYNLSLRGPILFSQNVVVIVPINVIGYYPPLVVSSSSTIRISVKRTLHSPRLIVDGCSVARLVRGEYVNIRMASECSARIVRVEEGGWESEHCRW
ncbi:MAG TPA: NAD(+)/NADH kinase [Pyrodictium sp.]|nr:NAD(+)/NADH kinase [Pyrodictium sp.]